MSRVIRIKRRLEEEPASVLYLAAKRVRLDGKVSPSDGITLKLLVSVGFDGSLALTESEVEQRSSESLEEAAARIKKRVRGGACRLRRLSGDEKENVILPENVSSSSTGQKRKAGVEIYDVVLEDEVRATFPKKPKSNVEAISCNGVQMEVHATLPEVADAKREEHDFVYDLYYVPDGDFGELSDPVFYLETDPYLNDNSLYGERRDVMECDDDADSNAEDNPQNDYPDEDDACEGEDDDDENYYCRGVEDEMCDLERLTLGTLDDDGDDSDDESCAREEGYDDFYSPRGYAAYKARVKQELDGPDPEKSESHELDDCDEVGSDVGTD